VIPTYNRGPKLRETLEHVLLSDLTFIEQVEVIVVDDGSPEPACDVVAALGVPPKAKLACIRQPNRGAGPARNAGYRIATGDMVLFMDDDILPPPALLQQHVEAHQKQTGAVIIGNCPIIPPAPTTSASRYIQQLWYDSVKPDSAAEFLSWQASSGNLSIMRDDFADWEKFYTEIPGGDDAELVIRLTQRGTPQLLATKISAPQDQSLTIEKQYARMLHHAYGLALVACNHETSEEMSNVLQANGPARWRDSLPRMSRKLALSIISGLRLSPLLLRVVNVMERMRLPDGVLHPCYGLLLDIAYFRGIRRGIESAKA